MATNNKYCKNTLDENDPYTYVVSRIDGKKYRRINRNYLSKYGYTIESYCEHFNVPRKDTVSQQVRDSLKWTENVAIKRYGEVEGKKRWNEYCSKQAEKNTFEFKHKKYGMTKEDFDTFNMSRACTKINFLKRYGDIEGIKKWDEYCKKQAYAGCSIDYFIDKYGKENGERIYHEVCEKKTHNLEQFINRYGIEEGRRRYVAHYEDRKKYSSAISQELFNDILKYVSGDTSHIHFDTHNGEYGIMSSKFNRIFFYDFVDTKNKKCIEFHGDVFHANPAKFSPDSKPNPYMKELTAVDIWKKDKEKQEVLNEERCISLLIVWESDYYKDKQGILNKCIDFLQYGNINK